MVASMTMPKSFEDLAVFKLAYRLSLEIHRASLDFPAIEQRALAEQIRRASKSICANLAEGFGKQAASPAEFKRFLAMAIGSADEMRVWTRYCLDWAISTGRPGSVGATPIRRWRRCCTACARRRVSRLRLPTSDI
jgi:four helix bundle protein